MTLPLPLNSQRRVLQRMNKTFGSDSKMEKSPSQEKNKLGVVKKIVMISSIKQEVKKIFLKFIQNGTKVLTPDNIEKIISYSKSILDNDKQKQLADELALLSDEHCDYSSTILKIIKEFVISPLQKSYIVKIEKELKEDQELEKEIKQIEEEINEEKMKKLKIYQSQKSGMSYTAAKKGQNTSKDMENFENKLMRANQKLNELSSNNNKLREKINQLRKQKNAMQDIYGKLKKELESKKENVENTIKYAGQAYNARNQAQQDLKNLKQQAQLKKEQFKQDCEKLNNEIQHDIRFKQFIKSKQIEKEQLEKLEEQIKQNEMNIEMKREENSRIDNEYQKSVAKEIEIKKAFDRIKKEIGFGDVNAENEGKQLLNVFVNLYQKNAIMKKFVEEITKEVQELQGRIEAKKEQIQRMYLKGSADECDKQKLNEDLKKRFQYQQKKRKILDNQYEKSVATISVIKKYLEDIFQEINVDPEITEKLKNCNINQENLTQFLGQLEKKGLQAISHYGKLVSEQLKAEKGNNWQIQKQIDELNNIITLQNVNSMNSCGASSKVTDYPSQLLIKVRQDKTKEDDLQKPLTVQELKKFAIQSLEQYQKKQFPKEKHQNKKYNVAPMTIKAKKK